MRRLRRSVLALAAVSAAVFCCAPTAGAPPRGGTSPCPYSVNLSYQLQWVPVPVSPQQSTIPMRTPTPVPNHTIPLHQPVGTTAVPRPHPLTTTHQQTATVHTTTRQEKTTEHTYPTRQETVHHTLTVHVTPGEQHTAETVRQTHTGVVHTETTAHHAEAVGGPGHGGEAVHVTAKPLTTTHSQVSTELRRYETQHQTAKVHVDVHEQTTVTHGEHKVTEHTTTQHTHTQVHTQTHTQTHPAPEPVAKHDPKKAPPEAPKVTPKESDPGKAPPDAPDKVRYVPVLKITAQVDVNCGRCHSASQPTRPLITANPPSCNRSPSPLLVDTFVPGRAGTPRPRPPFLERPTSPFLIVARNQPVPAPPPNLMTPAPRRPPGFVTSSPSGTTSSAFWGEPTLLPVSFTTSSPETPGPMPTFTGSAADGSERQVSGAPDALDSILDAPALPPVVALPPAPDDRPVTKPAPSASEVVLDPPALPPVPLPTIPDAWARVAR
jgi:hypothetical protein